MIFLYNISIRLYILLIRLVALWNKKAGQWLKGRKNLFEKLKKDIRETDSVIWIHCSSAGEFEQGKPIIEKIKKEHPGHKILVSFFSPSGFQVAAHYEFADHITYLPLDTKENAKKFLNIVRPQLIIFIKYEFWYHHLSEAAFRHIPLLLVSAVFRKDQLFFKSYGRFYRSVLFLFRQIFVQDTGSLKILRDHNINHCQVSGDTRFDRVIQLAGQKISLPVIDKFVADEKIMVAGSTWPRDENLLAEAMKDMKGCKLILAPHEISPAHLHDIMQIFPGALCYSQVKDLFEEGNSFKGIWSHIKEEEKEAMAERLRSVSVLIIDNVGMLSRLYDYSSLSYVGGGFSKDGIHNVLEPAAFAKPVIFGPNYKKYREASELIDNGAAVSISTAAELRENLIRFLNEDQKLLKAGTNAGNFVRQNGGASEKILLYIQENRLLTS